MPRVSFPPLAFLLIFSFISTTCAIDTFQSKSSKRGLVYVPNANYPNDDKIWISNNSDLTWYYNYVGYPSPIYENSNLEFIPMLWGAPGSTSDTTFLNNVTAQILGGANITYVMSFNEPDNTGETGGSNVDPVLAASAWKRELEPLRKLNVTLGAPAVTGGTAGWTWLREFFTACDGGCTAEFLPVHWYGNYDGLASHIGQVQSTYPNMSVWVTEYALTDSSLADTQSFFKESCEYFDGNNNITHYSYFGSFRSGVSNVGPNVAMLTSNGSLTDIGAWYLDEVAHGYVPDNLTVAGPSTTAPAKSTYIMPALVTTKSEACSVRAGRGWPGLGISMSVAGIVALGSLF